MFHFVHKLAPVPIPTLVVTWPFLGWVRPNARLVDIVSWIGRVDQAWSGRRKEGGVVSSVVVVLPVNAGKLACMQTRLYTVVYHAHVCAQQKHAHALWVTYFIVLWLRTISFSFCVVLCGVSNINLYIYYCNFTYLLAVPEEVLYA